VYVANQEPELRLGLFCFIEKEMGLMRRSGAKTRDSILLSQTTFFIAVLITVHFTVLGGRELFKLRLHINMLTTGTNEEPSCYLGGVREASEVCPETLT
jgi:hypothetical protein